MARRKARIPQGKKLQPAVDTMVFDLGTSGGISHQYIDLSQCASLMNRRFYRQGLNWAVAGFTWIAQGNGSMTISKIPDTWVASNAWMKGFAAWQKMNEEALEESESVKSKFTDFKVFMDSDHHSLGSASNLIPRFTAGVPYTTADWDMSVYAVQDTTSATGGTDEREIIWTGSNYPGAGASGLNAVSLIEGYAASRALPDIQDPNTPDDADSASGTVPQNWQAALFNESTEQTSDVLDLLTIQNDQAPYPFENGDNPVGGTFTDTQYPGGANQAPGVQEHDISLLTATTVGGHTNFKGGNFQGGLIKISYTADATSFLIVHLVRGPHRGYMCQSMQDV